MAFEWMIPGTKVRLTRDWTIYRKGDIAYIYRTPSKSNVVPVVPRPGSNNYTYVTARFLEPA